MCKMHDEWLTLLTDRRVCLQNIITSEVIPRVHSGYTKIRIYLFDFPFLKTLFSVTVVYSGPVPYVLFRVMFLSMLLCCCD